MSSNPDWLAIAVLAMAMFGMNRFGAWQERRHIKRLEARDGE